MNDLDFHIACFNTPDYPGKFVLRRKLLTMGPGDTSEVVTDDRFLVVSDNYETIRECIPWDCINIGRSLNDDPVNFEVWIRREYQNPVSIAKNIRTAAMDNLDFYTVYYNPSDYPGKYVLRRSVLVMLQGGGSKCVHDDHPLVISDNIDTVREVLPRHLVNIGRTEDDDPVIFEVWI